MRRPVLVVESYSQGEYVGKKTIKIDRATVGSKSGWAFSVYFDDRTYPNVTSALYKTIKETVEKRDAYVKDGALDTYGSAE
jgi:2',3'-cyclic-nucleotide 2'-phosphodiesterase (5'-nucleotidase family)